MFYPCVEHCMRRYNKDYTAACDITCDYAAVVKENLVLKQIHSSLPNIFEEYRNSTYVCSLCGQFVFPEVEFKDGEVNLVKTAHEFRGGLGNNIFKTSVCEVCADETRNRRSKYGKSKNCI